MTRVDFYILAGQRREDRLAFCCRLIEKAWLEGHQILIQVDDNEQATRLDDLLWQFKPESFIPHGTLEASPDAPVAICWGEDPGKHHDVLVNLSKSVPGFFSRFERVLEVVIQDDQVLKDTREHFRFFKERGYPIKNTDMRMVGAEAQ